MKKKLLPMVLVCCMLAAWLAAYAQADDIIAQGDCGADGSNVQWTLDSKGTLTISGKGAMQDYKGYTSSKIWYTQAPWSYAPSGSSGNGNIITSLIVGNGITGIGTNSFVGLANLSRVSLPDSLIRIKENAFRRCTGLTKITFPDSIVSIEDGVFWECSNLLNFTVSDSIISIGENAFCECDHLTKMVIPKSVENISKSAFRKCDRLQSVTILGDVSVIKTLTFEGCLALTEIAIPDSVEIIAENAFSGCTALKDVYFPGTESLWNEISMDGGNTALDGANIHFDTSVEATYRINSLSVSDTEGETLTEIPDGSFLATVSITNRASDATPIVFLTAYDAEGQYQGLLYATVEESVGATAKITLPVDNADGKITQLKAFAVDSFATMKAIGNPVSFPA